MAGNNNSSSGTNRMAVPEAKDAMKRFKEEVASELGVPLKDGYNGDLTSAGKQNSVWLLTGHTLFLLQEIKKHLANMYFVCYNA